MDWFVGITTLALAVATGAMAWKTRDMASAANDQAAASRDQAEAARSQIGLIEIQLAEARDESDRRAHEAADAYGVAIETLRESIRSRLDASAANVSIYATPSDLTVTEPAGNGDWHAVDLEQRLPLLGENIADWRFCLSIDFRLVNRSDVAVEVNAPNPGPGSIQDVKSNRFTIVLAPNEERLLDWSVDMTGVAWWRWCTEGQTNLPVGMNPQLVDFHFVVNQPLLRGVVQNHKLSAAISPCVVRDGAIRQVHANAVQMRRLAAVEMDYVGLRDFDSEHPDPTGT